MRAVRWAASRTDGTTGATSECREAAHSTAAVGDCTAVVLCPLHRKLKKEEIQKYYDIKEKLGTSVERDTEQRRRWSGSAARGSWLAPEAPS